MVLKFYFTTEFRLRFTCWPRIQFSRYFCAHTCLFFVPSFITCSSVDFHIYVSAWWTMAFSSRLATADREFSVELKVGYHVYKRIWNPTAGQTPSVITGIAYFNHYQSLLPRSSRFSLQLFFGGSAEGVQWIGSGPSTQLKKLVIMAPRMTTSKSRGMLYLSMYLPMSGRV